MIAALLLLVLVALNVAAGLAAVNHSDLYWPCVATAAALSPAFGIALRRLV